MGRARLRHHGNPGVARRPVRLIAARGDHERRRRKPAAAGASLDALHSDGRVESNRLSLWDRQGLGLTLEQRHQGIADGFRLGLAEPLALPDGDEQCVGDPLPIGQPVGQRVAEPERKRLARGDALEVALVRQAIAQHDRAVQRYDLRPAQLQLGQDLLIVE